MPTTQAPDTATAPRRTPRKPAARKPGPGKRKASRKPAGWAAFTEGGAVGPAVTAARAVLTVAFAAAAPAVLGVEHGRRLVWTVAIAALPLFWLVGGFHLWRRVCPLAVLSQVGRLAGRPGRRKAGPWLSEHYFELQLGLMVAALSLRLVATNGTAAWLAGFLVAVTVAAAVVGLVYTGKTWCNYVCPVGMVEKIYTEPSRLHGAGNSQCGPCTACKKNCPDIDLEQGYWKEMTGHGRRVAYFAWPGVVVGFYVYFYLVAGSWDYYFSGAWAYESAQAAGWLSPGFTFLPRIPRAVAAPLTLIAFGAASFAVFAAGEAIALARATRAPGGDGDGDGDGGGDGYRADAAHRVRHRALVLAGFVAFNCFYFFGGQPTLRAAPAWVVHGFGVVVVFASAAIFFRRWSRTEADHVQERFAQKLVARWEWGDAPPPGRLQDVYLLHTERQKQRETRLAAYKDAVREMVADGVVTRGEMALLDTLRARLGVTEKEHDRVLGQLGDEERQLFDAGYQGSVELRLQREQYERDLERAVLAAAHAGATPGAAALEQIRTEHGIEPGDHRRALARLLDDEGPLLAVVRDKIGRLEALARAARAAGDAGGSYAESASMALMRHLCLWRCHDLVDRVLALLAPVAGRGDATGPAGGDATAVDATAVSRARARLADAPLERLPAAAREAAAMVAGAVPEALRAAVLDRVVASLDALAGEQADEQADEHAGERADGGAAGDEAAPEPVPEPFWPLADDPSEYVRAAVALLMSRWDDDRSRQIAVAATEDPAPIVRESAFRSLGSRGRITRELLTRALADPVVRVRHAAVRAVTGGTTGELPAAPDAALLAQTTRGTGRHDGMYATLDARARIESLTTIEKMMLVRTVPMFRDLDPEDLEELTRITAEHRFADGDRLCRQGDPGGDVFLLVKGTVQVYVDGGGGAPGEDAGRGRDVLNQLGPGAVLGEMSAFDASPRSATAVAVGPVRALRVPAGEFRDLLLARPAIASAIIGELVGRLRDLIRRRTAA